MDQTVTLDCTSRNEKALRETQTLRDGCSKAEPKIFIPPQHRRRQLVGTWARAPLAFERIFFSLGYTLKRVVWFGLVLCQTLNLALFVQPYRFRMMP